mmetsp:Transcript_183/g.297  ORF Transcript_183/g.297 Transcript_183/m.297 type:complete len:91 (-) Transcript_183:29-301(-)
MLIVFFPVASHTEITRIPNNTHPAMCTSKPERYPAYCSKYSGALTSTFNGKESEVFVNVPTSSQPNDWPNHPGPKMRFMDMKNTIHPARM